VVDSAQLAPWPSGIMSGEEYAGQWERLRPDFLERLRQHRIPADRAEDLARVCLPLAAWVNAQQRGGARVVGINGAQGSGKTTLADFLGLALEKAHGLRVARLSIDDLYKTRADRERLAREVHPLLLTRGVPGTHDTGLGLATLRALRSAAPHALTPLPAFDKARDDRKPAAEWPLFRGRPDVILFEGWCVGTVPQPDEALMAPVNALERDEDTDGAWRRQVNDQLRGAYAELFGPLDRLVMLKVPGMDQVFEWRALQERKLAATLPPDSPNRLMDAAAIQRFIMHYERLTRHNLAEMPGRADLVVEIDENHRFTRIRVNR
jgi:D-glycerate 3-kinase